MKRVLLVSGSQQYTEALSQLLKKSGHDRITTAENGNAARRMISEGIFELIVISTPLANEFGHELAAKAAESSDAGIILITNPDVSEDISDKLGCHGICVMAKPVDRDVFLKAVRDVYENRSRVIGLDSEDIKLLTKIEEIRLINRAKICLMQYLKFSEPQAHRYIEKQAMDTRQTKKDVAKNILSTYEQ